MPALTGVVVAAKLRQAIDSGAPVVALESAVITHGLPRAAALQAVRRQSDACQLAGAIPAVVAVFGGQLVVGLSPDECAQLAAHAGATKVSPWNLAAALIDPGFGGTTVAATMAAAVMAGVSVVSTGGIGGVHPGDGQDVSADLTELSRRRVAVVCAGPKSTLDAAATMERLETLGVPVIGWKSSLLAGFLATSAGIRLPIRADSIDELVQVVRRHWDLGGAGVVISQPLPAAVAIPATALALDALVLEHGPGRTPAELARLQARLGDQVIQANLALLDHNASLAAGLALALSRQVTSATPHG
jgi:pseudouridylate synthase